MIPAIPIPGIAGPPIPGIAGAGIPDIGGAASVAEPVFLLVTLCQ